MSNPFTFYMAAFLIFLALTTGGCSSNEQVAAQQEQGASINVKVALPENTLSTGIITSGQIESSQTASISTRVMGYITNIYVKVGDRVTRGQVLATISADDLLAKRSQADANINEAEAALASAQKDMDRYTNLYKQQSATAKELDNITLQYQSAKSRLEAARQMRNEVNASLAYTRLTAPFSGIITQKLMDAGSIANPGMAILTMEQSGSLQVSANIPESDIQKIKLNDHATVNIKALNREFQSTIIQVYPSSAYTGGQYIIKIQIPEQEKKQLAAGMYVNVIIASNDAKSVAAEKASVMVPVSSLENKDQLTGLYTVADNTALLRWIRTGKVIGDKVEVLSGLNANESFVVHSDSKLYNGAPVKVIK